MLSILTTNNGIRLKWHSLGVCFENVDFEPLLALPCWRHYDLALVDSEVWCEATPIKRNTCNVAHLSDDGRCLLGLAVYDFIPIIYITYRVVDKIINIDLKAEEIGCTRSRNRGTKSLL